MAEKVKIECPLCKDVFFHSDFHEGNAADTCSCGNVQMGISMQTNNRYAFYVTVCYAKEKPVFYQIFRGKTKKL